MLTRRKHALMLLESPKDPTEEMTLLSLHDGALLEVLSRLSGADLCAAGLASPRLRALTRTHASLWRGKRYSGDDSHAKGVDGLVGLLRVAPRLTRLQFEIRDEYAAHFDNLARKSRSLTVACPSAECCATLVEEVGVRLKRLAFSSGLRCGLGSILSSLRHTPSLVELVVYMDSYLQGCDFRWPQSLVLSQLRNVVLRFGVDEFSLSILYFILEPHPTLFEALRSLLLAHRRQLLHVQLFTSHLLPLLDSCPSRLERLTVLVDWACGGAAGAAGLRRMRGLKHLAVMLTDEDPAILEQTLGHCRCPLEGLSVAGCNDEMLRALGRMGLASVKQLELLTGLFQEPWGVESLDVALAGLPNLVYLTVVRLLNARPFELLRHLSAASIPNLCLIVFPDNFNAAASNSPTDYPGFRDCHDLVQRAPKQLHVAVKLEGDRRLLFFRHSVAKSAVAACEVCAETEDDEVDGSVFIDQYVQVR